MKKALFLLTLVFIFCNFRFIDPVVTPQVYSPQGENTSNDANSGACECGTPDAGNHLPADATPPVFSFHDQTFTKTGMVGVAQQVIAPYSLGVNNEKTILGTPDGNGAKIKGDGKLTVKLGTTVPAGSTITIYWRQETGQPESSTLAIKELATLTDDSTYYSGIFTTDDENYLPVTTYANIDTRYLELHCLGSSFLRVDAVTYSIANASVSMSFVANDTIEKDAEIPIPSVTDDCDPIVDVSYDDSVTVGISGEMQLVKRKYIATDDCGNISYAEQNIVVRGQGVADNNAKPAEEVNKVNTVIRNF